MTVWHSVVDEGVEAHRETCRFWFIKGQIEVDWDLISGVTVVHEGREVRRFSELAKLWGVAA